MNKNLLMLDYDGVIVDSYQIHVECMLKAFRLHCFFAIETPEEVMALYKDNLYSSLEEYGLTAPQIDEIIRTYKTLQDKHLDELQLFPDIKLTLAELAENSDIYIITSNISAAVTTFLRQQEISCILDVLGSDKEKSKVKKIAGLIAQHPGQTAYYVGDTQGDILEGKAGGANTIGAAWGWHGKELLAAVKPDYLIESAAELKIILT